MAVFLVLCAGPRSDVILLPTYEYFLARDPAGDENKNLSICDYDDEKANCIKMITDGDNHSV